MVTKLCYYYGTWEYSAMMHSLNTYLEVFQTTSIISDNIVWHKHYSAAFCCCLKYRDYFMESVRIQDFHMSCWSIWNRRSECNERVRFLILHQRVWKSCKKHFPCFNLFILYIHCTEIFTSNFAAWKSIADCTTTNQRGERIFSLVEVSFRLSDWSK